MSDAKKSAQRIGESSSVRLHFALRLAEGEQVDSTFDGEPAQLTIGDGSLPPGFERCLLGLEPGQHEHFELAPEDGFGQRQDENIQQFSRETFAGLGKDETLAPGLVVSFSDAAGGELPGVVSTVDADQGAVDFNHPLAGRRLQFEVEILSVTSSAANSVNAASAASRDDR